MIYLIERETEIPFDNCIADVHINNKHYDVVVAPKNSGLDSISEHIIDDGQLGMIFVKTNPREQKKVEAFIEEKWGPMSELLLG